MRKIIVKHNLFFSVREQVRDIFKENNGELFKSYATCRKRLEIDFEDLTKGSACKVGCHWCCHLKTDVNALELLVIAEAIKRYPRLKRDRLIQCIQRADRTTHGMTAEERADARILCPLCMNGKCEVYQVRPGTCMVYHSMNAKDCLADYLSYFDSSVDIQHNSDLTTILAAISIETKDILAERGLESGYYELNAGLAIALGIDDPIGSWLSGKPFLVDALVHQERLIDLSDVLTDNPISVTLGTT